MARNEQSGNMYGVPEIQDVLTTNQQPSNNRLTVRYQVLSATGKTLALTHGAIPCYTTLQFGCVHPQHIQPLAVLREALEAEE